MTFAAQMHCRAMDGAMGFWSALDKTFPGTKHQRCWVHKVKNVQNCFPKQMAPAVKSDLDDIQHAGTRAEANAALAVFSEKYGVKYPKGVACLTKDEEAMLAFFDFPAEHWGHLRTSNPIESVFATVRHRTVRTKGALSQKTTKLMVFTSTGSIEKMAAPQGQKSVAKGYRRNQIQQRCRSDQRHRKLRRLMMRATEIQP
jgi:transposase-like protein